MKKISFAALCLIVGLTATGCGGNASTTGSEEKYPDRPINMTVGGAPGSGFDLTLRTLTEVLGKNKIVDVPTPIDNRPGADGGLWASQMIDKYSGADDRLSVTSLVMMTNHARGKSEFNYDDVTMIAQLMTENFAVVTNKDSGYGDLPAVLNAVVSDPGSVPVGAASDDQMPFALLVEAAGGDASKINFVAYEGGGEQSTALLSGDIDVAIAGSSELLPLITSGDLKALAVVGKERYEKLSDVPTTTELGYDVTIANWRGIYGPPNMPDYAVKYWQNAIKEALETKEWRDAAEKNQWVTSYRTGEDLNTFLKETNQQVTDAFTKIEKG
ncbi:MULTISPECIES: tripartite tricarboxylate transporter substrate binding protein [unclassified Arthrobacter]|uniref:tripartite tricarboxylate transporter substrate binding protein n=1 Tax=Arthrobacter sp. B2I5 TaxID=3042266 RepID=UPI0027883AF0|nr:tripartite tricarboxylate transporter substrate-binding protein [Arthrobacter sp. B2I5]MDQ0826129.1 putative tricarboxylic transport membrane protein [Arthrobacter sp. B2I5]